MAVAGKYGLSLCCIGLLLLQPPLAGAQDMPAFQGKRTPLVERPTIVGRTEAFQCEWHRKSNLLRKDMYDRYPAMHRKERISVARDGDAAVIAYSGTGTFDDFATRAQVTHDDIRFDIPPLTDPSDKKLFLFGRAATAVLGYWSIVERPAIQGSDATIPAWQDPVVVAAVSRVVGRQKAEELLDLEVSGIDLGSVSLADERNAYLYEVNRSVASHCTLNRRFDKEECIINALGWTLYDRDSGLVIEQDMMFTLLWGDGLASRVAATWRERLICQRAAGAP